MKSVLVLMSTYNGEKFIREQLESILTQKDVELRVLIRDDGSTDKTVDIIKEFKDNNGNIKIIEGENIGYKRSFLWLLDNSETSDYYAFADQDDVWLNDKLITAVEKLEKENSKKPLLYTSALQRVDENLRPLSIQSFPGLKLTLYSEFVRHRFAGCTYVFNNALKNVCKGTSDINNFYYSHDSWVSLMCWSSGGQIIYDATPHILFRRYGDNVSADNSTGVSRLRHEFEFLSKKKHMRSSISKIILTHYNECITSEARQLFTWASKSKKWKYRRKILNDKHMDCGISAGNWLFKICVAIGCL